MRAKATVSLANATFEIGYAVGIADSIYKLYGHELVVTSANDSTHGAGSLHYKGKAVDLRTRNLPPNDLGVILKALKARLEPQGFDVVLESDHIHVELDVKPGESFVTIVP